MLGIVTWGGDSGSLDGVSIPKVVGSLFTGETHITKVHKGRTESALGPDCASLSLTLSICQVPFHPEEIDLYCQCDSE